MLTVVVVVVVVVVKHNVSLDVKFKFRNSQKSLLHHWQKQDL